MAAILLAAAASLALAFAASFVRIHKGTTWLLAIALPLLIGFLLLARYFPVIPANYVAGRPFAFFQVQYAGHALAAAAGITAVTAALPTKPYVRVVIATVGTFGVAWGGFFVT
jgi:hypothetical protein